MKNSFSKFFTTNPEYGVSTFRLYLMRIFFVLIFILLGLDVWKEIISHQGVWDPLYGVAYSFWAAFSTLALIGLRYPLKMLPLLLLQFFYKLVWLFAVAYPLWSSNQLKGSSAEEMTTVFIIGIIIDLIVIPWSYALKSYILKSAKS